jgi:tetratricopeptide (TPR) repeat protein
VDPVFIGRYRVLEELGRGGMGIVYKAEDPSLERLVAIKILPPKLLRSKEALKRFLREAKVAAKLDHPNIIPIYDIGEDNGIYYMVMEYLEGKTLREWMEARLDIDIEKSLRLFKQIAEALGYAHKRKVIHRDVKPENIMVIHEDKIKVMDFGIAVMDDRHSVTQMGAVLGTIAYISPEQAEGKQADARSDIYSLGIVLFELLTNQLPFQARTASEMITHHLLTSPPPPSSMNKSVSKKLDQLVLKTLAKNPEERYQNIPSLLEDLKSCIEPPKNVQEFLGTPAPQERYPAEGAIFFPAQPNLQTPDIDKTKILDELKNLLAPPKIEEKPKEENQLSHETFEKYRPIVDRIQKDLEALQEETPVSLEDQLELPKEKIQVPCTKCGSLNDPLQKYCLKCGSLLASSFISPQPEMINQGISLFEAGQNEEALKFFQEALKKEPRIAEAYLYTALCYMKEGHFQEAELAFRKVVELEPRNPAGWEGLGDAAFKLSNHVEAESAYQTALKISPSASLYFRLGLVQRNLEKIDEAYKSFAKAFQLDPENLSACLELARTLMELSRYEEALQYVRGILIRHPQDVEALHLAGEIYEKTNRFSQALQAYEKALNIKPDFSKSRYKLGSLLEKQNRADQAILHLTKALETDPSNPDIYIKLGKLFLKENKEDEALVHLKQAANLNPNNPEVHKELGKLFMKKNDLEQATIQLEWTVALDPTDADAHGRLGQIYFRKNQTQHSIRAYKTAIQLDPYNPEFHENLGMVYFGEDEMEDAIAEMKKAVSLDPENVDYRKALGVMYETKGRLDEARKEYQKAVEIAPYDALAQGLLGRVYFEQNLLNLAIYQYQKSLELDPKSYLMHNLLGKAYLRVGKYEEAIVTFQKALEFAPKPDSSRNKQILGKNYFYLGEASLAKGDTASAVAALQQAVHLLPTFAKAFHLLGKARLAMGDKNQAQQLFLQASRLASSEESEIFVDLAQLLSQSGDQGGAIRALTQAIQAAPQQAAYHGLLGDLYFAKGDLEEALNAYQQALKWEKNKKDIYHWKCGNLLIAKKNYGEAIEQLKSACLLAPDNWRYHQDLARVYEMAGMIKEAVEELEKARGKGPDPEGLALIQETLKRLNAK